MLPDDSHVLLFGDAGHKVNFGRKGFEYSGPIFSTRVSKTEFIAGKAMGTLMLCLLQVFLLVVFSALASH